MLLKHVVEVVLNTSSTLQSSVDNTELSNPGNMCDEFGMKLYYILRELPLKEVICVSERNHCMMIILHTQCRLKHFSALELSMTKKHYRICQSTRASYN